MADENIRNFDITTSITDGIIYMVRPTGGSGAYEDYQIPVSDLLNAVNVNITALQTANPLITQLTSQTTSFTSAVLIDYSRLYDIEILMNSGTLAIKVGTSAAADDVMIEQSFTSGEVSVQTFNMPFASSTTLYFTLTGTGNVDINIIYRLNVFT